MPVLPPNGTRIHGRAAGGSSPDPGRWSWASLRPSSWPNALLAAVLIAILTIAWVASPDTQVNPRTTAGGIVALVPFVLILWRPRIPEFLLGAAVVCGIGAALLGVVGGPDIVAIVAVYTIATKRPRGEAVAAMAVAMFGSVAAALIDGPIRDPGEQLAGWAIVLAVYAAAVILGLWVGGRRAYMRTLVDHTEDLERERDRLEREREQLAREAVAVERARIARELHDVVAHHVSVMVIQAGAAQATLPPDAGAAGHSLEAIRQTGREALAEMRRMLDLLRSDSGLAAAEGDETLAPQPGLAELPALAERMREAGLTVDLEAGPPRWVPAGVDLSAYRVAQEALTNTLRHAGAGSHVHVCLDYQPQELVIEVVDDGRGRRPAAADHAPNVVGHGLVGMRERVALFGGSLEAGPRAQGGFRILARFPVEAEPLADDPRDDPPADAVQPAEGASR